MECKQNKNRTLYIRCSYVGLLKKNNKDWGKGANNKDAIVVDHKKTTNRISLEKQFVELYTLREPLSFSLFLPFFFLYLSFFNFFSWGIIRLNKKVRLETRPLLQSLWFRIIPSNGSIRFP